MILAPLTDARLEEAILRASLPEEDVVLGWSGLRAALDFGFPRLLVCRAEEEPRVREAAGDRLTRVPVLVLAPATLEGWDMDWRAAGHAVTRIDDSAHRLRSLIRGAAVTSVWVEGVFADLTLLLGRGLPVELRGLGRRVMEYPSRYPTLDSLSGLTGLTGGALRAKFRRRGLPSPSSYLRWFRLLAAARHLSETRSTTLVVAHFLGFGSDGNFCRWVRSTSGIPPSGLRAAGVRMALLARMMGECFPRGTMEGWARLEGVFLRQIA